MVTKSKLENAYFVCRFCGPHYGKSTPKVKPKELRGVCDICDHEGKVTTFKSFGYEKNWEKIKQYQKDQKEARKTVSMGHA